MFLFCLFVSDVLTCYEFSRGSVKQMSARNQEKRNENTRYKEIPFSRKKLLYRFRDDKHRQKD